MDAGRVKRDGRGGMRGMGRKARLGEGRWNKNPDFVPANITSK